MLVVTIKNHSDNGRFEGKDFIKGILDKGQGLTYCVAHAHFQNDIAEKGLRDLQECERTITLYAKDKLPEAIETSLWPYEMRLTCDIKPLYHKIQ